MTGNIAQDLKDTEWYKMKMTSSKGKTSELSTTTHKRA